MKERPQIEVDRVERRHEVMFDEYGREKNSGVPLAPPVGYVQQPSMIEIVRQQIRSEHLRLQALEAGMETFDEADDFEVEDDYDPSTPYEEVFDPVDYEARNRLRQQEFSASVEARLNEARLKETTTDGSSSADKGRSGNPDGGSRHADKEPKGKPKSEQDASDGRSVEYADRGNREVEK